MFLVGARDRKNEHVGFVFKLGYKKVLDRSVSDIRYGDGLEVLRTQEDGQGKDEFEGDVDREMWIGSGVVIENALWSPAF